MFAPVVGEFVAAVVGPGVGSLKVGVTGTGDTGSVKVGVTVAGDADSVDAGAAPAGVLTVSPLAGAQPAQARTTTSKTSRNKYILRFI